MDDDISQKRAKAAPVQGRVETRSKRILNASYEENISKSSHSTSFQLPTNQKIREGCDFQVPVASAESVLESKPGEENFPENEICFWKPDERLADDQVMSFCRKAHTNYGINIERALYILYSSNYDLDVAEKKLNLQTVFEETFSEDDQFTFRHALSCYGKNFSKMRQMIPHKSVYALVQHYYNTKKSQHYSAMEMDNFRESDSSEDESKAIDKKDVRHEGLCENCNHFVKKVYAVNELELCMTCKLYFTSTNQHRPCRQLERPKQVSVCPPDMRTTASRFLEMAATLDDENLTKYQNADESGELQIACPRVTKCQQIIEQTKEELEQVRGNAIRIENLAREQYRSITLDGSSLSEAREFLLQTTPNTTKSRRTYSWTPQEKETAFYALVLNKGNCQAVAEILTTKTPDMVKSFYDDYQDLVKEAIKTRQKKVEKAMREINIDNELKKYSKLPQNTNGEVINLE